MSNSSKTISKDKQSSKQIEDRINTIQPILHFRAEIEKLDDENQLKARQLKQKMEDRIGNIQCDISVDLSNNESAFKSQISRRNQIHKRNQLEIATLLEEENKNLKQQNRYFLQKIRKMQEKDRKFKQVKEKKEKYKQFYIDTCEELQSVRQQSEIYWKQIQEIKNIAIFDIERLKQEVVPSGKQKNSSDCKSYSSEIYTSDGFINVSHERVKTSENQYI